MPTGIHLLKEPGYYALCFSIIQTAAYNLHCSPGTVDNYTKFFVAGNKTYLISKTLGEYDTLLTPHHFIRTHKSHLVNKKFVSFIDHDGYAVLKDSSKVEVSRRRKDEVMTALR